MKTLEKTGKIRLVGVNSSSVVHRQRIVEEIDFFDDQKPKRLFLLPQRKGHVQEILFPEILMIKSCPINISLTKKRALDDHQQSADDDQIFKKRKIVDDSEIKSFGVNIVISGINDDYDHHKIVQEKSKMIIDEQRVPVFANLKNKKKERCSKKRIYNPRNNNHIQEPPNPNAHIAPPYSLLHPWLLRHIELNGGSQPQLLFEKKLEKSDVEEGLGRLFVTRSEKLLDALTEEERRVVMLDEESKRGSRVYTVDPEGNTYELFLKRWPSLKILVLNHHWRKLCSANRLQKGDIVRGWGYRQSSEFRLALNFIRKDQV